MSVYVLRNWKKENIFVLVTSTGQLGFHHTLNPVEVGVRRDQ